MAEWHTEQTAKLPTHKTLKGARRCAPQNAAERIGGVVGIPHYASGSASGFPAARALIHARQRSRVRYRP